MAQSELWPQVEAAIGAWAAQHGFTVTPKGAEALEVDMVGGRRDDFLVVSLVPEGIELLYYSPAGTRDVWHGSLDTLPQMLAVVMQASDGWVAFLSQGPGPGH